MDIHNEPISLHPQNPHYFIFRGEPCVLITSAEHYGAVLNLDFNYVEYLEELYSCGLNHTRVFSGVYYELPGAFGIENNTLAPKPGRYICPWIFCSIFPETIEKYDLGRWDEAYFSRLKDFCSKASELGIVIEFTLFCSYYLDKNWKISPMNIGNNINGVGNVSVNEVYTLRHQDLLKCQTALTEKIVRELNGFDNIIFEICNEPWADNIQIEWEYHISDTIVLVEAGLPFKHLISWNPGIGYRAIENPNKDISIINFHYAALPGAVAVNYELNRVIGMNETGFAGCSDNTYRHQAWELLMSGGALFNNLDFSFAPGYEKGTFKYSDKSPGGGSRELRSQLKILKDFICSFNFVRMVPDNSIIKGLQVMNGIGYMLAERGQAYAMYIRASNEGVLDLDIPSGRYVVEWFSPKDGSIEKIEKMDHSHGGMRLEAPPYRDDIALSIKRVVNGFC